MYSYYVQYRPGADNVAPDTLSRVCGAIGQLYILRAQSV